MEKLIHFLEGMKMTIVGGMALLVSLGLLLADIRVAFDPAWITIVICGLPLLWLAVTRLIYQRWVSSALLIVVAMFACIYIGELFAAGEVAFIMALGALLEDYAVARAKRGVNKLLSLAPDEARLIDGKETRMVSAKDIMVGNVVRVLPGEKITVDGEVVAGSTSIDQSIITGESLPIDKTVVLTGDNRHAAEYMTKKLGISQYRAELLPAVNSLRITSRSPSSAHCRGSCRHSGNSGGRGRWRRAAGAGRCRS